MFQFKKKRRNEKQKERKKFLCLANLKYLPLVLSKKEKTILFLLSLAIVVSLFFLVPKYYKEHILEVPKSGGNLIEGVIGQPKLINPILCQTNEVDMDLSSLIYSGLMKYDASGKLISDLAESYEIKNDGKSYLFHLRKEVKWHDGTPLTADDVIFTVESIKDPEYKSPLYLSFKGVDIEKIDDFTLKFALNEPFAPFLFEQTTFGILPKHIFGNVPPENFALVKYNLEPVGTGPFKFLEYKKDKQGNIISFTLEKNENYYLKIPYLEKITFRFFEDYSDLIQAYQRDEITSISFIPQENIKDLKKNINLYSLGLPKFFALFFNQPKNECLKIKEVRQALAYSLDKKKIVDLVGQAVLQDSPIPEGFLGYNPEVKKYEYNQERALQLLTKAGFTKLDQEGKRWKEGLRLEIAITSLDQPPFNQIAELIKQSWENIGAQVHLNLYDPVDLQIDQIKPRNYEVLLYGESMLHDPDPWPFWHSSQRIDPGLNLTSFKDETVDELLTSARYTLNTEERIKKYLHFQNILAEEVPAIFLYRPTYLYGVDKSIKGVKLDRITFPSDRLTEVNLWYIKTKRIWKK